MARQLAERLKWRYLDTGALYRAVALAALEAGIPVTDGEALGKLAHGLDVRQDTEGRTWLADRDVSGLIRTSEISAAASPISAHPPVREALVEVQRRVAQAGNLVCEGRDMGSVIFPQADLKVYLDARPTTRAERRHLELKNRGEDVSLQDVLRQMEERDVRDSSRTNAPLQRLKDQVYLDSSNMEQEEVLQHLLDLVDGWTGHMSSDG